ncbi:SAV_915 family protein [Streptomyces sclerotialus]|uniref:SAV_915 family protein n=1 Tax=Streptomyces sclerotialus TaxID=1957 RepID=UPI00068D194E
MADTLLTEDPEPLEHPAGPLYVPVRPGPMGYAARLCRTPLGCRTAVGFTTEQRLVSALGPGVPWIRLAEPALRALVAPLGVTRVTVDARFAAPNPRATPHHSPAPEHAVTPAASPALGGSPSPGAAPVPKRATAPAAPYLLRGRAA